MICPKCGYERTETDDEFVPAYECPSCSIVYEKYNQTSQNVDSTASRTRSARVSYSSQINVIDWIKKIEFETADIWLIFAFVIVFCIYFKLYWTAFIAVVIANIYHSYKKKKKLANEIRSISRAFNDESNDEDESNDYWEIQQPFPVNATIQIKYKDAKGDKTNRIVDVQQFGIGYLGNVLYGFCHLRQDRRTFYVHRILECVDAETGEIVDDVHGFLRSKYENSPEYSRDILAAEEYDTLRVMLYVGKADGQLRGDEKAIICETCRMIANDSRITDRMVSEIFQNMPVPSIHAFKLAVGRLSKKNRATRVVLMQAAEKMVATQKTVHPHEQVALDYMKKRLFSGDA